MQISNNGDLLISINGKTKLLSKEEIVRLYNQDIAIASENNNVYDKYYLKADLSKYYSYSATDATNYYLNSEKSGDTIVDEIREKFLERSKVGQTKYGTNLDRTDLSTIEWLNHAIEEQMDSILYLTKLKKELNENNSRRKL